MRALRRLAGAFALIVSAVGILVCVAAITGIWTCHHWVSEKVRAVSGKLDGGLERVSAANLNVQRAIQRATADIAAVRKEVANLDGDAEANRQADRTIRKLIQQRVNPDIDELGGRLATVADTAAALSSLLQSLQDVPLGQAALIDADQLAISADLVQGLSGILRRLEAAAGDGDAKTDSRKIIAATGEVAKALQLCRATVDEWQSDLNGARERLAQFTAKIVGWLTVAAIAVTVLVVWVGAGQVSLFAHGLRWCRG